MKEINEVRIGRYLAGEAGQEEREALERELGADPVLREEFMAYKVIWENAFTDQSASWDESSAFHRFNRSISERASSRNTVRKISLSWAVAAAVILTLGAAVFFWNNTRPVEYTFDQFPSSPLRLVDGTEIYLNEGGSVKIYPFTNKKRLVQLEGEAYFDVAPDPSKPFIVEAGETITEVVGTSFNIKNEENRTSIFVTEGKVIFFSSHYKDAAIALTSGEAAYFENNKLERIVNPSPNAHAWHSRELTFVNMPLSSVIADVSSYFKQNILIENESVKNCRITYPGSFKEPDMEILLEAIALTVNANVVIEDKYCIIRGGNCF